MADYTIIVLLIVLSSFVFLFRCFQKIFIAKRDNNEKCNNEYKHLLVELLKNKEEKFNISDYYELLTYTRDKTNYKKLENYIKQQNKEKLIEYAYDEFQRIQSNYFSRFSGLGSFFKLVLYGIKSFRISDYVLMPFAISATIIYFEVWIIVILIKAKENPAYVGLFVAFFVIIICVMVSYAIICTDRYAFEPSYIKLMYFIPVVAIPCLFTLANRLFLAMVLSGSVYIGILILLYTNRKRNLFDVSPFMKNKKTNKYKTIYDFAQKNNEELISAPKDQIKTIALFDPYSLVAVYQFRKISKREYKLERSIFDITFETFTDEDLSLIKEYFDKKKISVQLEKLKPNSVDNQPHPHNQ